MCRRISVVAVLVRVSFCGERGKEVQGGVGFCRSRARAFLSVGGRTGSKRRKKNVVFASRRCCTKGLTEEGSPHV